jgi:hypothetical protein
MEASMATNLKSGKTAASSKGSHGGNRGGSKDKRDDQPKKSSQAAGKDPKRGKDA